MTDHDPDNADHMSQLNQQRDEDVETIRGLREHVTTDHDTIAGLRKRGAEDRGNIDDLEQQSGVDHGVILALIEQGEVDRKEIANLQKALISARRIGAAIGIIMGAQKCTEEQAFDALRTASQNGHRKLRDVADDVLVSGTIES
jgi:hypothetical protein